MRKIKFIVNILFLVGLFLGGYAKEVEAKPTVLKVTQLIKQSIYQDLNKDFNYFKIINFQKQNGQVLDSYHYIADVQFTVLFEKSIQDVFSEYFESIKSGKAITSPYPTYFGSYKRGEKISIVNQVKFVKTDNGWILSPEQQLIPKKYLGAEPADISIKLFSLDGTGKVTNFNSKGYSTYVDKKANLSFEITDFRPHNVENMAESGKVKDFQDLGPSVDFVMRGPGLKPVKIRSFMNAFEINGENRGNFMQVSFSGSTKGFESMALGLDLSNSQEWELMQRFIIHLADADLKNKQKANMQAFKAAMDDVFGKDKRPDNFQAMAMRVLQAVQVIPRLPWPYIPVLGSYKLTN